MAKFYELYESLILEADPIKDDEEDTDEFASDEDTETPTDEVDTTTDDWSSETEPSEDEEQNPDEEETDFSDEEQTTDEEEPIEAPAEQDYTELEVQAKGEARVEDMATEISDKMLDIAMERFEAFRKVLKKKGIESMVNDFIDNYYTTKMSNKVDSLFIDLYADDIKAKTAEKIKHALTDLSLKKDDVESEPVPEKEEDKFWSM